MTTHHVIPTGFGVDHCHGERTLGICQMHRNFGVAECIKALAFEGRMAIVGYVDNMLEAKIDIQALHMKRLQLFGVSNKLRTAEQKATSVAAFVADVLPALTDGRIRPFVDKIFEFGELPAAKAYMEENRHMGKIVLRGSAD